MPKVIMIDDEFFICKIVQDILEVDGYETLMGATEADARRFLAENEDVVAMICDLTLGAENGLTIQRRLEVELWERRIVFILLHGHPIEVIAGPEYLREHRILQVQKPTPYIGIFAELIERGRADYAALAERSRTG